MPATARPRRSVLFIPAANARAIAKAKTIAADAIILDLEDAVPPEAKAEARALAAAAVAEGDFDRREVIVRINGLDTPWAAGDIAAIVEAKPDAILVPKVSRSEDIRRTRGAMAAASARFDIAIWAMLETPLAVLNAGPIGATAAEEGAPLAALVLGLTDLAAETGARQVEGRAPMLPWIATFVAAARAFEIAVIDGDYPDPTDLEGFEAECRQAHELGMDGKTLTHPNQVEACNAIFAPSPDDVAWALTVAAAFDRPENIDRAVITIDGRVVERLHERQARRTVQIARQIRAFETA